MTQPPVASPVPVIEHGREVRRLLESALELLALACSTQSRLLSQERIAKAARYLVRVKELHRGA